jgi:hypothetical protein
LLRAAIRRILQARHYHNAAREFSVFFHDTIFAVPGDAMPSEQIGKYEIEYAGVQLANSENWGAQVAIFGPSSNPMHRTPLFPEQRVSIESVFPSREAAEAEARKVALSMIE